MHLQFSSTQLLQPPCWLSGLSRWECGSFDPLCLAAFSRPPCARHPSPSSSKTSLTLQFSSLFSSQFLHRLPVSVPLCLPIYQRELLSRLLRAGVGKRWKGCLIARKNLQLCFILYRTGCCSCRCRSASAAASHQIFSPPHKKTCLLPVLQIDPLRWHKMSGILVGHSTWFGPLLNLYKFSSISAFQAIIICNSSNGH